MSTSTGVDDWNSQVAGPHRWKDWKEGAIFYFLFHVYLVKLLIKFHIAGNFCEVQIFMIFVTHEQNAKIRTAKYKPLKFEHKNFWTGGNFTHVFCALIPLDLTMAL